MASSQVIHIEKIRKALLAKLTEYLDPYLAKDLVTLGICKDIAISGQLITIKLVFGFAIGGYATILQSKLNKLLKPTVESLATELKMAFELEIACTSKIVSHEPQAGLKSIPGIKNIIAVGSGKGGVGKSTVAANLALALKQQGSRVGILDADIYGPSQPQILGCSNTPEIVDKQFKPNHSHGIYNMSIGYLFGKNMPTIWRGPMVSGALLQLLHDTLWPPLDYLVVDLPPGTGDIQLTLAQKIPVSGAVIVTTPQDVALLDAQKAVVMFQKLKIAILGVIENMSSFYCPNCNHQEHIFGTGGGKKMVKQYASRLLGELPLNINIRKQSDDGTPIVVKESNSVVSNLYKQIAMNTAAELSKRPRNLREGLPQVVIEP